MERAGDVYDAARAIAADTGGHYMDQFTYAERATDWRGNNNIAESMFTQMQRERHRCRAGSWWVQVRAAPAATIGRYLRYQPPRHAGYAWPTRRARCSAPTTARATPRSPRRARASKALAAPRVEPSFIRTLVDRMEEVADDDSVAAMRALSALLGRRVGPSTGTNFVAMLRLAQEMAHAGAAGVDPLAAVATRASATCPPTTDDAWVQRCLGDCAASHGRLQALLA
nr:pyridoxal-phosphate dependent enzyme [Diaphorobacter sp. JS3051]